jgi:hypothetical protein
MVVVVGSSIHLLGGTITTYYFRGLGFIDTQIVCSELNKSIFNTNCCGGGGGGGGGVFKKKIFFFGQGGSFHPSILGTCAWMISFQKKQTFMGLGFRVYLLISWHPKVHIHDFLFFLISIFLGKKNDLYGNVNYLRKLSI